MWSRKRLDIGWSDLLCGTFHVCFPSEREGAARRVERLWPNPEHTLACLSVRTGFDLLLDALDLPPGAEVLVSAITIPGMIRIIERHGLVPVPVDLDPQQMSPTVEHWRQSITPATRLILVAHLFGGHTEIEPLLDLARQHRLLVIEDCAQAFASPAYDGHPQADVSMFSFGMIKSKTALGGAILRVRDEQLLARMRIAQAAYPMQTRGTYLKRLAKCAVLKTLACRPICSLLVRGCRMIGCNYDQFVNRAARGFPDDQFFAQIRRQPSAPLLAILERRLKSVDSRRSFQHEEKGRALTALLHETVLCPGAAIAHHTYWVFPILANEPTRLIDRLARAGFDSTQGQSLCVVEPPTGCCDRIVENAKRILESVVFLPFYPEMPVHEWHRMAATVLKFSRHPA